LKLGFLNKKIEVKCLFGGKIEVRCLFGGKNRTKHNRHPQNKSQKLSSSPKNIFSASLCLSIKQTQSVTEQSTSFPSTLYFHVHNLSLKDTRRENLRNAHIKEFNYIFIDHKLRDTFCPPLKQHLAVISCIKKQTEASNELIENER
jgi:hypothetical protein